VNNPRIKIVIPSYNGVSRVTAQLRTILEYDPAVFGTAPITVFEDPCGFPGIAEGYDRLKRLFPVEVKHLPTWSNMHGAAQYAFENTDADWIIYLGDDVFVTPHALSNMVYFLQHNELETVDLVQFPYWNAHDLSEDQTEREYPGPALLRTKHDMYDGSIEWLKRVPRHKHWDGEGYARAYVNVNGVGFAARKATWEYVGGFCKDTWCLDESISVRVWLESEGGIVCLPGPPVVHFFAGATLASPPAHDRHTEEAWIEGMKMTKAEAGRLSYEKMFEREPAINEEMRHANYYR
jgi:glycosyltransferase involved in cell wall biosynthesis